MKCERFLKPQKIKKPHSALAAGLFLEATPRFELGNRGFAGRLKALYEFL